KGLMQVRSPIGPLAPSVVIRKQIRTPKLELLPARVTPRKGLFLSTLLHTATAATLAALPILFPSWLGRVPSTPRDLDREFEVVYQPLKHHHAWQPERISHLWGEGQIRPTDRLHSRARIRGVGNDFLWRSIVRLWPIGGV